MFCLDPREGLSPGDLPGEDGGPGEAGQAEEGLAVGSEGQVGVQELLG